jgi:hypothetical protein
MKSARTFFLTLGIFCLPVFLFAHPMGISFDEMIHRCKKIVVAKFLHSYLNETSFSLQVEYALKGKSDEGRITVGRAYGKPRLFEGDRFMAFINEKNELEWAGYSDSLETDMIDLVGFYDFNAYDIWPSGITMVQLKEYLADGKFEGTVEGNLEFFNYKTQLSEKTETAFKISYTYFSEDSLTYKISSSGLKLVDFKPNPSMRFWGNGVGLTYEENEVRPLEIDGYMDSVYADGKSCHAQFSVREPEDVDKESFDEYLAHPEYGPQYYELEFTLNDTGKYTCVYGIESGRIGYLIYNGRNLECESESCPTKDEKGEFHFGGDDEIVVYLDVLPDEKRFHDFNGYGTIYFIPGLRMGGWKGDWLQKENGKQVNKGKCTVTLKKILFTKNVNYGK